MFGTIRKHQTWIWFLIIGVMILAMVMWTNSPGGSGHGHTGNFGSIDGKTISADEFASARNEAILFYFLQTREWPDSPEARSRFDENRETYSRLFLIRKLEEYNIHPDPDAVAKLANVFIRNLNNGQNLSLTVFANEVLTPKGITIEDFQNFVEHYLGIRQLESVIGAGGNLVTPQEIRSLYVHSYQEIAAEAVFFSASNYLAKVPEPTPQVLSQFYTNQQAAYREPEQMQVRYVFFNVTNYLSQSEKEIGTTNLNEMAQEALARMGTNGLRYGKTPEEALAKIRDIIVRNTAISNANVSAIGFEKQMSAKNSNNPDILDEVAKANGMEVKVTKPFEKEYGPSELHLLPDYPVETLFNLNPQDQPFVDTPVGGEDGVYIIAYKNRIESRIPSLDEIHSRVLSDYKFSQALRLAQVSGHAFYDSVTNQLAHGKKFSDIAAQANVTPMTLAPFSLSSERLPEVEDLVDVNTFKQVAFATPSGASSSVIPTRDGAFLIYVRERLPIDEAKMKEQLPEFSNAVRQRRESEAFSLWFNKQASISLRDAPLLQQSEKQGPS